MGGIRGWYSANHGQIQTGIAIVGAVGSVAVGVAGFLHTPLRTSINNWLKEPTPADSTRLTPRSTDTSFAFNDAGMVQHAKSRVAPPRRAPLSDPIISASVPEERRPSAPSPVAAPAAMVATRAAVATAPADAHTTRTLAKGTALSVQPVKEVCDTDLRSGATIAARLTKAVTASDNSEIPAGTSVTLAVVERRVASGDQDPVISLEATSITSTTDPTSIETRTLHFALQKPSMTGTVVKGAAIGAVGGAVIGLVLRKNVGTAAMIGAAAGGAVGAAKATTAQACIEPNSTVLPFTIVQTVGIHE